MKFGKLYKLLIFYRSAKARQPLFVDAVQSGTLMGISDLICQTMIENKSLKKVDLRRTIGFSEIGFFVCGPVLRIWFGLLHTRLKLDKYHIHQQYQRKTVAIKKVFLDQIIFAPIYIFLLLIIVGISQGKPWTQIEADLKSNFLEVLAVNYCIWPFVQLFNFYFIPVEHQVLVGCIVCLCWDTYLSWVVNQPTKTLRPKSNKNEENSYELMAPKNDKEEDSLLESELFTNSKVNEDDDSLFENHLENADKENEDESLIENELINTTGNKEEEFHIEYELKSKENETEKESLLENKLVTGENKDNILLENKLLNETEDQKEPSSIVEELESANDKDSFPEIKVY